MYQTLSKYRRELMGLAIILIMICHTTLYFEQRVIRSLYFPLIEFCKIGVDIFFLMSGIGLYYSFYKDKNVIRFYRKRLLRILPTYAFVIILWALFSIPTTMEDGASFLWKYSLISFFVNGSTAAWFVAAILVLYLVFPFIYTFLCKHSVYSLIIPIYAISFAICMKTMDISELSALRVVNEAFVVRIPTFLMGVRIGQCIVECKGKNISKRHVALMFLAGLLLLSLNAQKNALCERWVERCLFLPIAISISLILGYVLERLNPKSHIHRFLCFMGGITLEIYLTHEKILLVYNTYIPLCTMGSLLANFSAIVMAVLLSYGISQIVSKRKTTVLCNIKG